MTNTMRETRSQRVDAAIADYLEAIEQGSPPDCEVFLRDQSDVEPELREFFAHYQALERAAPRSVPTPPANPQVLPRSFGQFGLLEEIARGGMGVVYKAR